MLPSILSPLLDDSRLTMPEMKSASNIGAIVNGLRTHAAAAGGGIQGVARATGAGIGATLNGAKQVAQQGVRGVAGSARELASATREQASGLASNAVNGVAGQPASPAVAKPASTNPSAAPGSISHVLQNLSMPKAMGYGALAGAAKGLIDPGSYTDENGNVQQRSRVSAVLGNAATGAALGGVAAPMIRGGAKMHAAMPVEAAGAATGKGTSAAALNHPVPPAAPATQSPIVPPAPAAQNSPNTSPVLSLPPVAMNPLTGAPVAQSNGISLNAGTPIGKKKTASLLPSVGPALKSASAQGNLDATINPMIAGVPSRTGDNSDSCGQISMDASTAKISAKAETSKLDASLNASIDTKKSKPGSAPFKLPALNLSKKK